MGAKLRHRRWSSPHVGGYSLPAFRARWDVIGLIGKCLPILFALHVASASEVVFTTTAVISPLNTSFDGQDIVISNCTVTVDGPHSFASLRVAGGGTVTHSATANGLIVIENAVVDEPQILTGTNAVTLANSNVVTASVVVADAGGLIVYTNLLDYVLGSAPDGLTTLQRTESSTIPDGGIVFVSYNYTSGTTNSGLKLTILGDAIIESGGAINVTGNGYGTGVGPGGGISAGGPISGGGGGHGGYGGMSSGGAPGGIAHDSALQPVDNGGAGGNGTGGPGGRGGGAVALDIGGTLQIDGNIAANGANGTNNRSGGGAGGSMRLSAQAIAGAGTISADGGTGEPVLGGGGGGGRIALYSETNNFSGSVFARGGVGFVAGGAGTIYTRTSSSSAGQVVMDNGGRSGTNTLLQITNGADLTITGGAVAIPSGSQTISNLLITSTGRLVPASQTPITVTVLGAATIQSGGSIMADAAGSPARSGQGAGGMFSSGLTTFGGGAGHGGFGAAGGHPSATGGFNYGSLTAPASFGSGGGGQISSTNVGGAGGGAIRLNVSGNLLLDGKISADGKAASNTGGGGGSGGSIWVTTGGTVLGSGSISANGGNGGLPSGGGGAGGRIAILYGTNSFAGTVTAFGGGGTNAGAAGTIYTKTNNNSFSFVLLDNGGRAGTNTPLQQGLSPFNLTIRAGAVGIQLNNSTIGTLLIGSNGVLRDVTVGLIVTSNVVIEAGGAINCDGVVNGTSVQGGGGGNSGTGGGHGGYGAGGSNSVSGGTTYDSVTGPTAPGSPGSPIGSSVGSRGGGGGGLVVLSVSGRLTLNGKISANGTLGSGANAGGGSGGGIRLTVGTIAGSGDISATGGPGLNGGGGGGGGRIAVGFSTNLYAGNISAYGGIGNRSGGAGTIYTKTNNSQAGLVLVDNADIAGTNTSLGMTSVDDVTLRGGGIAMLTSSLLTRNLLIASNGWLTFSSAGASAVNLTCAGNATVQPGGGIIADGRGGAGGLGSGSGSTPAKGGGGHGGFGGGNPTQGGNAYGSLQTPTTTGSSGANGSGSSFAPFGGSGGGAIRLSVTQTLTVNGRVSADGLPGDVNSGGGSGGSVWLTVGTLAGTGTICANGGAGGAGGGGGGGGRIALNYTSNLFTSGVSTYGGSGSIRGGAGTIYSKPNSASVGKLVVDNGGSSGTNTPLSTTLGLPGSPFDLAVLGGAAVHFPSPPAPLLSNVVVATGGLITSLSPQTNLDLAVLHDLIVMAGSAIAVDGKGYGRSNGPGAGATLSAKGAGGGYGGSGGASASGANGGTNYGSSTQPVDRGSGGGAGSGTFTVGSDGGGAIRLTVGGTLTLDGRLGANGSAGIQDDSGGGAGGSIWVTAGALAGGGMINADGGSGELFGGGGGGGGRIALYSLSNAFTGQITTLGGAGAVAGSTGTIFSDTNPGMSVVSQIPTGLVSDSVSTVDLGFNMTFNPYTADASDVVVQTPTGVLASNVTVSPLNFSTLRVSFPLHTIPGDYTIVAGPQIEDLFGRPMSQVHTGSFTVSLPVVQGTVTDTNGQPVAGVLLQLNNGWAPVLTDDSGNYAVGFVPPSSFTVTPALDGYLFLPGTRSYTGITNTVSDQNYLAVTTIAPMLRGNLQDTNLLMNWLGLPGVTYQLVYSTNLADWLPYGSPISGSNVVVEIPLPIEGDPMKFFKVLANN